MKSPDLKADALALAATGIPVFPCRADKRPLVKRGFHAATTDAEQVKAWWTKWPAALIGRPTAGLVVIDCDQDPSKTPPKDGDTALLTLEEKHGGLPSTYTVQTRRGGLHRYFIAPDGGAVKCSTDGLAYGVDVRAAGGYVIVPPSPGYTVVVDAPMAELPPAWVKLLVGEVERATVPPDEPKQDAPPEPDGNLPSRATVEAALAKVSADCGYNQWIEIGQALHDYAAKGGLGGLDLWDQWSKTASHRYEAEACATHWATFKAGGGVTIATLFHRAGGVPVSDEEMLAGLPEPVDAADYAGKEPPEPDPVLVETFDAGDKVLVVGSSKARKTYFILQGALAIAAGKNSFLGMRVAKPRRVLVLQFEIKAPHYWRRVYATARAMEIDAEAIRGNFHVMNLRGYSVDAKKLRAIARKYRPEVLIVDPLYKLLTGDENTAEDVKPTLAAFDQVAEETGATVVFLHHNPKGYAGDRQTIDRGSGSSVITRDYDAAIYLTNHKTDGLLVLETVLRNYPPREKQTLTWAEGQFVLSDERPEEANSRNRANGSPGVDVAALTDKAVALVKPKPIPLGVFMLRLQSKLGLSDRKAKLLMETLLDNGTLARTGRLGFGKADNIGVPTMVEQQKLDYLNTKTKGCEE